MGILAYMKITTLSADELELKEGGATGVAIGVALVIGGVILEYYAHNSNSIVVWIALGLGVAGIAAILFSSSITVNANKASGQLRYQKKRLVGAQNSTYAIADVFRIETRKQWRMENAPSTGDQNPPMQQPVLVAQSVIVFKDGREVPLDHQKTSSTTSIGSTVLMGGQGAETAMAAQVAKFLNVPFQEIAPPNMGMGINIIDGPGGAQF
jgi:Tfp pilus assembly PilM family ATPase